MQSPPHAVLSSHLGHMGHQGLLLATSLAAVSACAAEPNWVEHEDAALDSRVGSGDGAVIAGAGPGGAPAGRGGADGGGGGGGDGAGGGGADGSGGHWGASDVRVPDSAPTPDVGGTDATVPPSACGRLYDLLGDCAAEVCGEAEAGPAAAFRAGCLDACAADSNFELRASASADCSELIEFVRPALGDAFGPVCGDRTWPGCEAFADRLLPCLTDA